MNPIAEYVTQRITEKFKSSPRWAVVGVLPGVDLYGIAFGRRYLPLTGVLLVLSLEKSGAYRLRIAPTDLEEVTYKDEEAVRLDCVRANRCTYAAKVHEYAPSPVYSALCSQCAQDSLAHQRAAVQGVVEQTLGSHDVRVTFASGLEIVGIQVRPPAEAQAPVNQVPAPPEAEADNGREGVGAAAPTARVSKVRAYRPLTVAEWQSVAAALGAEVSQ